MNFKSLEASGFKTRRSFCSKVVLYVTQRMKHEDAYNAIVSVINCHGV